MIFNLPNEIIESIIEFFNWQDCGCWARVNQYTNKLMIPDREQKVPPGWGRHWPKTLSLGTSTPLNSNGICNDNQIRYIVQNILNYKIPLLHLNLNVFDGQKYDGDVFNTITQTVPLESLEIYQRFKKRTNPPGFSDIIKTHLKKLSLNYVRFYAEFSYFKSFSACTTLTELNLTACHFINSENWNELSAFSNCLIERLNLSQSNITDFTTPVICKFPLKSLDISFTQISDGSLPLFKNKMTNLDNFKYQKCRFTLAGLKTTFPDVNVGVLHERLGLTSTFNPFMSGHFSHMDMLSTRNMNMLRRTPNIMGIIPTQAMYGREILGSVSNLETDVNDPEIENLFNDVINDAETNPPGEITRTLTRGH